MPFTERTTSVPVAKSKFDQEPSRSCISVCTMDQASGLCIGCYRTLDEIAGRLAAARQAVMIEGHTDAKGTDGYLETIDYNVRSVAQALK